MCNRFRFLTEVFKTENSTFFGKCTLSIRFETEEDYEKWSKALGNRKWEFLTTFPAIMRAEYKFSSVDDIDIMVRKIVQLLQLGFDVHAANWQMAQCESQLR